MICSSTMSAGQLGSASGVSVKNSKRWNGRVDVFDRWWSRKAVHVNGIGNRSPTWSHGHCSKLRIRVSEGLWNNNIVRIRRGGVGSVNRYESVGRRRRPLSSSRGNPTKRRACIGGISVVSSTGYEERECFVKVVACHVFEDTIEVFFEFAAHIFETSKSSAQGGKM